MMLSRSFVALLAIASTLAPAIARADTAEEISYNEPPSLPTASHCPTTLLTIERNVREMRLLEARTMTLDENGNIQLLPVEPPAEWLAAETLEQE